MAQSETDRRRRVRVRGVERDSDWLLTFRRAELTARRWLAVSSGSLDMTDKEHLEWCARFPLIYDLADGRAALFVSGDKHAEIHFAANAAVTVAELVPDLIEARCDMFENRSMESLTGWVARPNHALKKLCRLLGMKYCGFRKYLHVTHGRAIEWQAFHIWREETQ